jgi:hypothetical protein
MIPWVLVALLGGLILGWVGRSVRAAGREWYLRSLLADAEVEATGATFAWRLATRRADQLETERDQLQADLNEANELWDAAFGTETKRLGFQ